MAFDYVSNQNNRNLQEGIGFKSKQTFKSKTRKTRKVREFPTAHPKEVAAFRRKAQKEARRQKWLNVILFTVILLIVSWVLYRFTYS